MRKSVKVLVAVLAAVVLLGVSIVFLGGCSNEKQALAGEVSSRLAKTFAYDPSNDWIITGDTWTHVTGVRSVTIDEYSRIDDKSTEGKKYRISGSIDFAVRGGGTITKSFEGWTLEVYDDGKYHSTHDSLSGGITFSDGTYLAYV